VLAEWRHGVRDVCGRRWRRRADTLQVWPEGLELTQDLAVKDNAHPRVLEQRDGDILVRVARVRSAEWRLAEMLLICDVRRLSSALASSISAIASSTLVGLMLLLPLSRSTLRRLLIAALVALCESSRICVRCASASRAARVETLVRQRVVENHILARDLRTRHV
jgi:hypothetical protein